jgi:hypothetical protein
MDARKTNPKLAHQLELERLYNKNQTISRLKNVFLEFEDLDFVAFMEENDIPSAFGLDLLVQMALHKRTTLPVMVSILRHHFANEDDGSQITADLILKAAELDMLDWNPSFKQLIVIFDIPADVQADLDRFQYPLPMVTHPRRLMDNRDTGYHLSRNSVILRKNHHEEDVCLDHINRMNKIRFSIDHDTAHMIANRWRDLDRAKEGETPQDFQRRVKAFEKYDRTAKEIIDLLLTYGNEIYLTHKYDKRGRTYCQGYHVTYQGAPWNKAVLELADKEVVPL